MEKVTCEWAGCTRPRTHDNICTYHWFRRQSVVRKVAMSLTPPRSTAQPATTPRQETIAELSSRLRNGPSPLRESGRTPDGDELRSNSAPPTMQNPTALIRIVCPECGWRTEVERRRARASLSGHIGAKHRSGTSKRKRKPGYRTGEATTTAGEQVLYQFGTTKKSKNNPVRLTDGRDHPVTVRRIPPKENNR